MKRLKRWQLKFRLRRVAIGCPNFWKEFPKENKEGPWVAEAFTSYFKDVVKNRILVHGDLFNAYVLARQSAYWVDMNAHPLVGVGYSVRKPIEGESYYSEVTPKLDFTLLK